MDEEMWDDRGDDGRLISEIDKANEKAYLKIDDDDDY
jgi:hypothetical protein